MRFTTKAHRPGPGRLKRLVPAGQNIIVLSRVWVNCPQRSQTEPAFQSHPTGGEAGFGDEMLSMGGAGGVNLLNAREMGLVLFQNKVMR